MKQNEKGLMQWEKDFFDLGHDPDHCDHHCTYFFYQTAHNINVPMIYTLATFFISRLYKRIWMGNCFLTVKCYFY